MDSHSEPDQKEAAKGYVRPLRLKYIHGACGGETILYKKVAITYARYPKYYPDSYCAHCLRYYPSSQFCWEDGESVGS